MWVKTPNGGCILCSGPKETIIFPPSFCKSCVMLIFEHSPVHVLALKFIVEIMNDLKPLIKKRCNYEKDI